MPLFNSYVHPDLFGLETLVAILAMVVVGGLGSTWGVLAGVLVIGLLPEATSNLQVLRELVYGAVLIMVVMFMPRGIAGAVRRDGMSALLEIEDLHVRFGGLRAVDGFGMAVMPGTIHALIGPNGAGKSTVLNAISRFTRPAAGDIRFAGKPLLRLPPHALAAAGIGRTFQNLELCARLSALDNVLIGMSARRAGRAAGAGRGTGSAGPDRARRVRRPAGRRARLRAPETARPGPRARLPAAPAAARRARRRVAAGGDCGARRAAGRSGASRRADHPAGRARDVAGDVGRRPRHRAEFRPLHRRRDAGGDRRRSGCRRGLSRRSDAMLRIEALAAGYGRVTALHDVSLTIGAGEIVCLLGANGAGKTTTLNCISGLLAPRGGRVTFDGKPLAGLAPEAVVARGIVQVPERRAVFRVHVRARESRTRRLAPSRSRRGARGFRAHARDLSPSAGAAAPRRRARSRAANSRC